MPRDVSTRFGESQRQLLAKLFRLLGSDNQHERAAATGKIDALLAQYHKSWADVPALLAPGTTINLNADLLRHICALGSGDADEREAARQWLLELLIRRRKSWNDLTDLLCSPTSPSWVDDVNDTTPPPEFDGAQFAVIDLVHCLTEMYVALTPAQRVAVTLWILHAHVYDRFQITPRLAVVSPVRGCGKTTLMLLIEMLVPKPERTDSISPAAIYHLIDTLHPTLLIDEGDNIGLTLAANGLYRQILNSGHHKGGNRKILYRGELRRFSTYAPMGVAGIGRFPLPLMHRSIVIDMVRSDGSGELRRLPDSETRDRAIDYAYGRARFWSREVNLHADPQLPEPIRINRAADNWRPLIAIADSFGPEWGRRAREAALEFARAHQDEDLGVLLLQDIRRVFDSRGADRLFSATLVAALNDIDDAMWSEWLGMHGNQQPRRLSQSGLAGMLSPFRIRSRTIWPLQRTPTSRSAKGYYRTQFEQA